MRRLAVLDPVELPSELVNHIGGCERCQQILEEEDVRQLAPLGRVMQAGTAARRGIRPPLLVLAALLPGLLNALVAVRQAGIEQLATLDWWRVVQTELVRCGLFLAGAVVLVGAVWALFKPLRSPKRLATSALVGLTVISVAFYVWAGWQRAAESRRLDGIFLRHRFVAFESPSFHPVNNPDPDLPTLVRELGWLRDPGQFDGLITFQFTPNLLAAAKSTGFKAVIVGIYVGPDGAKPTEQMQKVIQFERDTSGRNNVVAYCVGHNTPASVPLDQLADWVQELRTATRKPVTSTFPLVSYLGDRGRTVRTLGDFYFPDVVASWHSGTTPAQALEQTRRGVDQVTWLADKPVMLKMVSYPSGPSRLPGATGPSGLSEETQAEFFRGLTRDVYLPPGVHISVFSGTDIVWKLERPDEFAAPEGYTGLFTKDGMPKPALRVVAGQQWPVQHRP